MIAFDVNSATLFVDSDEHTLEPGVLARVGPAQKRRVLPGPDGFRMVAVGGRPGEPTHPPPGPSSADRFPCRQAPIAHKRAATPVVERRTVPGCIPDPDAI